MSVSMAKSDGVTILTMTSDPGSACPPLCQILKALCYSPVCCSVSQKLRSLLGTSHSALGGTCMCPVSCVGHRPFCVGFVGSVVCAIIGEILVEQCVTAERTVQVMVGMMNIGLGLCANCLWFMHGIYFSYWMGALFIFFGFLCILSEKFPSPCLVVSSVSAQVTGTAFSIVAVVLHSLSLSFMHFEWVCGENDYYDDGWESTPAPIDTHDMQKCLESKSIIKMVLAGVNVLLIVLSVLQLCVSISCVVLGIRAVRKALKQENKATFLDTTLLSWLRILPAEAVRPTVVLPDCLPLHKGHLADAFVQSDLQSVHL